MQRYYTVPSSAEVIVTVCLRSHRRPSAGASSSSSSRARSRLIKDHRDLYVGIHTVSLPPKQMAGEIWREKFVDAPRTDDDGRWTMDDDEEVRRKYRPSLCKQKIIFSNYDHSTLYLSTCHNHEILRIVVVGAGTAFGCFDWICYR